jgi:hypothetical protein
MGRRAFLFLKSSHVRVLSGNPQCPVRIGAHSQVSTQHDTETSMSATPSTVASGNKKWADMAMNDRIIFVAKICIMVCSGGFIFANILADDIPAQESAGKSE